MSKHTPGPWQVSEKRKNLVIGPRGHALADCKFSHSLTNRQLPTASECIANAKLIAAAPELLEIAKEHAASCPSCNGTGQRMHSFDRHMVDCEKCRETRAAIAKATGAA